MKNPKVASEKKNWRYFVAQRLWRNGIFNPHPDRCSETDLRHKLKNVSFLAVLGISMLIGLILFKGLNPLSATSKPLALYQTLGTITSVEVHHTTFSADSSIQTNNGMYQVEGAVTAKPGDSAYLRRYVYQNNESHKYKPQVCVESIIKPACYRIL